MKLKERVLREGRWEATMWMSSREAAVLMRRTLEELGYSFRRDATEKAFTSIMVLVPIPQFSYVFQFIVFEPSKFLINLYDTRPRHGAIFHHIEIKGIDEGNLKDIKKLLNEFSRRMGRKPYEFPLSQRFQGGFLSGEFFSAKRRWSLWGI